MLRVSVTIDAKLLREAQAALGASSKAETLRIALTEVLRRRRLAPSLDHRGTAARSTCDGSSRRLS
jgi:Arc/MetJ family transcription regulator